MYWGYPKSKHYTKWSLSLKEFTHAERIDKFMGGDAN